MNAAPTQILLGDACILIDLAQSGHLGYIKLLVQSRLADVLVPRNIYEEVRSKITESDLLALGMKVIPVVDRSIADEVEVIEGGRLSEQDRTLFVLARRLQGAVWTNDKNLGKLCKANSVAVYRILGPFMWLIREGLVSRQGVDELVADLENTNSYLKGKLKTSE